MFTSALSCHSALDTMTSKFLQILLFVVVLSSFSLFSQQVYAADNTAFCATVTGASAAECQALMDIYDNTGGATSWTAKVGWGTSTTICSWTGVTCTSSHVSALNLTNNNLTGAFSFSQGNLDSLTTLTLTNNAAVTSVALTNNKLTTFTGTGMTNLATLDLHGNKLTTFTNLTGMNALTTLDLSYNVISGAVIPSGMSSVVTLNLSHNLITDFYGNSVPVTNALSVLDLSYNSLSAS